MAVLGRIPKRRKRNTAAGVARGLATIGAGYLQGRERRRQEEAEAAEQAAEEERRARVDARAERGLEIREEEAGRSAERHGASMDAAEAKRREEEFRDTIYREFGVVKDDQMDALLAGTDPAKVFVEEPMSDMDRLRMKQLQNAILIQERTLAMPTGIAGAAEERAANQLVETLTSQNIADIPASYQVILDTAVKKAGSSGFRKPKMIRNSTDFGNVVLKFTQLLSEGADKTKPEGLAMAGAAVSSPDVQRAAGVYILKNAPIDEAIRQELEERIFGGESPLATTPSAPVTNPDLSLIEDLD